VRSDNKCVLKHHHLYIYTYNLRVYAILCGQSAFVCPSAGRVPADRYLYYILLYLSSILLYILSALYACRAEWGHLFTSKSNSVVSFNYYYFVVYAVFLRLYALRHYIKYIHTLATIVPRGNNWRETRTCALNRRRRIVVVRQIHGLSLLPP
jgi:hypothetical protein